MGGVPLPYTIPLCSLYFRLQCWYSFWAVFVGELGRIGGGL